MRKQLLVTVDRGETRVAILESEGSPSGNSGGRGKKKAEDWRWGSLSQRRRGSRLVPLSESRLLVTDYWADYVNAVITPREQSREKAAS